jgi:uncharacterized damage-inducible protein DinB
MDPPSIAVFPTLASYNAWVNGALWEILEGHPNLCREPDTTYYGSIVGLLSHVTLSDITWVRRSGVKVTGRAGPLELEFSSLSDVPFPDIASWYELRATDLGGEVLYRNSAGREFVQPLWQVLLHMFNPQTHHRGQVAQVLDRGRIENDVSNLIWYLRE